MSAPPAPDDRAPQAVRGARAADDAAVGAQQGRGIERLATGIPGFDHVTMGGLPRRRATVVAGQAGSAKTVFAAQFLVEGVRRGQPGRVRDAGGARGGPAGQPGARSGWDVAAWEASDDWRFVDASPLTREDGSPVPYSFSVLAAQIGHAVDETGADRVVLDSLNTVFGLSDSASTARQRLRSLVAQLRASGLTVVMTVETASDPAGSLSRTASRSSSPTTWCCCATCARARAAGARSRCSRCAARRTTAATTPSRSCPARASWCCPSRARACRPGGPPSASRRASPTSTRCSAAGCCATRSRSRWGRAVRARRCSAWSSWPPRTRRRGSAACCSRTRSRPSRSAATPSGRAGPSTGCARRACCGWCRSTRRRPRSRTTCWRSSR